MPSWFSKVFAGDKAKAKPISTPKDEVIETPNPILAANDEDEDTYEDDGGPKIRGERNVVQPEVVVEDAEMSGYSERIAIKAKITPDRKSCVFMVDRPVLEGYSAWFPTPEEAADSPLAQALFAHKGVWQVLVLGTNITVTAGPDMDKPWPEMAKDIGQTIREHLMAGKPVVTPDFLEGVPTEEQITDKLDMIVQTVINPEIAGHSGAISLERVEGNTVYIKMMGGCQGCAASDITLRQGIHTTFREAVPQIGAILDETDHASGDNPYFKKLPPEMQNA